jgi:thiol:disulfide interchange protein DsbD
MKADWTNEDPVISRALAEYGRLGVPLYLLFPKGGARAEVLPQILTQNMLLEAVPRLNALPSS